MRFVNNGIKSKRRCCRAKHLMGARNQGNGWKMRKFEIVFKG